MPTSFKLRVMRADQRADALAKRQAKRALTRAAKKAAALAKRLASRSINPATGKRRPVETCCVIRTHAKRATAQAVKQKPSKR